MSRPASAKVVVEWTSASSSTISTRQPAGMRGLHWCAGGASSTNTRSSSWQRARGVIDAGMCCFSRIARISYRASISDNTPACLRKKIHQETLYGNTFAAARTVARALASGAVPPLLVESHSFRTILPPTHVRQYLRQAVYRYHLRRIARSRNRLRDRWLPAGLALSEADIQPELDRRKPGTSRHVTQRQEAGPVQILSGVYEGVTTGTPIALLIRTKTSAARTTATSPRPSVPAMPTTPTGTSTACAIRAAAAAPRRA
jgi:hypothetical protein